MQLGSSPHTGKSLPFVSKTDIEFHDSVLDNLDKDLNQELASISTRGHSPAVQQTNFDPSSRTLSTPQKAAKSTVMSCEHDKGNIAQGMSAHGRKWEGCTFDKASTFQFGYGSLINKRYQKELSDWCGAQVIPVRIKANWGMRRAWNFRHPEAKLTALGLEKDPDGGTTINGVIYPVSDAALVKLATREVGYGQLQIPIEMIEAVSWQRLPDHISHVICYGVEASNCGPPNPMRPIVQSYVDVCLEGCLDFNNDESAEVILNGKNLKNFLNSLDISAEEKAALMIKCPDQFIANEADATEDDGTVFAKEFIDTTFGWSDCWVNDRDMPRRPWLCSPMWSKIDALLRVHNASATAFKSRHILGEKTLL